MPCHQVRTRPEILVRISCLPFQVDMMYNTIRDAEYGINVRPVGIYVATVSSFNTQRKIHFFTFLPPSLMIFEGLLMEPFYLDFWEIGMCLGTKHFIDVRHTVKF